MPENVGSFECETVEIKKFECGIISTQSLLFLAQFKPFGANFSKIRDFVWEYSEL
jgi:hypothetical protein